MNCYLPLESIDRLLFLKFLEDLQCKNTSLLMSLLSKDLMHARRPHIINSAPQV